MALTVKFSDFHGEVFAWTGNLPLISESVAQSYEANDSQYYSYTTITMEGRHNIVTQDNDLPGSTDFPTKLYELCVNGVTGTLEIGTRRYFGYFTNFTADGNEPSSVRWSNHIPYTVAFSTFPSGDLYDSTFSSTWETMPYDQTYGPVYKVTQNATFAGTLIQKGDNLSACSNRSLSGVRRAYDGLNDWYSDNILTNSYFGYNLDEYDFYDLQGTIDFDEITGSFTLSLSWLMKDIEEGAPRYEKPYHIVGSSTSQISSDFKRTYKSIGTIQGLATGEFPTGLPVFDATSCRPKSNSLGFSKEDRYKHALMGFDTISIKAPSTIGNNLLPEDEDWHGGTYFSKSDAPSMQTGLPAQSQVGYNPYAGTITYDYTYDDQPSSVINEAITEAISSRDKKPGSKYEQIQVIGRRHGPIVRQSVVGYDVGVKSITYEGIFPRDTTLKKYSFKQSIMDEIDTYVMGYAPNSSIYNVSIVEDKTDLTLTSNKVIRSITWNYSECPT
jgi:hypothetical protein